MKKAFLKVFIAIFVASLFFPLFSARTESASLTSMSDTMSRLKVSVSPVVKSNHTIVFTTPSGVAALQKIKVTFPSGFASGLNSVAYGDMDLLDGASDLTLAANCATTTWGASVSVRTITFTSCTGTIAAGHVVTIKIGTNATGGVNQITNPGVSGTNTINLEVTTSGDVDVDTGSLAVAIMDEDQITVTATVNPTISSVLSGAGYPICALGTLSSSAISVCTYKNRVNTNATSGYTSTIVADGALRSGTHNITDEDGTAVDRGSEEYGIGTNSPDASLGLPTYTTCQDGATQIAGPVSTTALKYADYGSPATDRDTSLCHAASITGATPAGSYSQIVTHITTGHF